MTDSVTVEQCDRDAAYEAYFECYEYTPNDLWLEALRSGKHDDDPQVQTLARHRIAERERCAGIAETLPIGGGTPSSWINTNESPMGATRRHIAQAIREPKP